MLTQPTVEKLYGLRLGSMAAAFVEQQKDGQIASLSFDERFALLVDAEHLARDNRRINTLLKEADLRIASACIEDVDASSQRGIDKALLRQLASCSWVDQNLNTLITGATGVSGHQKSREDGEDRGRCPESFTAVDDREVAHVLSVSVAK